MEEERERKCEGLLKELLAREGCTYTKRRDPEASYLFIYYTFIIPRSSFANDGRGETV